MKPFNVLFEEQKSEEIYYNNLIVKRMLNYKNYKQIKFKFRIISTNSKYIQAIVLLFSSDFVGKVYINGVEHNIPKKAFPKINFWEDTMPPIVETDIIFDNGFVSLCNGADPVGNKQFCRMLTYGSAMILEDIGKNKYIVKCNDFENDDDFDDLIFEMEIIELVK